MTDRKPLDELAEDFLERQRRGEWPQISEYVERYPDLADDIREVFPPLVLLERAAQAGPGSVGDHDRIGPYRLLRLLGRGGQGEVHLAEDTRLGRQVALKVLPPGTDPSGQLLARFEREAAITARLDHPGICTVYEAGEDRGTAYIAMRHVEGQSLAERLAAETDAATSSTTREGCVQFVEVVEKVARALEVAHGAGLIHRDIKPGNIMLTPDGEPVILDFGLARDITDEEPALTRTGMMMGTPIYMSPEQITAERQRVDHRTDIYSLGVTLYECVTGRRPFDGATWEQLYNQIISVEPENPRRLNPVIPNDLRVVLATAMDKDRDRRYQTAAAFANDLRNVRELQPIHAKPAGPLLRARRWAQRNPVLATSVAALFVALAAGLIVTAVLLGDARTERDAKARALKRANGLSLAAQSLATVERDPGLALSLAVEAAALAPSPQVNDALLRALAASRELVRIEAGYTVRAVRPALAFRDGGRILFSPGGRNALWDVETGAAVERVGVDGWALSISPDAKWVIVWTGGAPALRAVGSNESTPLKVPGNLVGGVGGRASFSADNTLVQADGDVWSVADGRFIGRFETVVFSPDGHGFLGWRDTEVVDSDRKTLCKPGDGKIIAVCWKLAFIAMEDGIRVFDLATGEARTTLPKTKAAVAVAWADAAGRSLFAVTGDAMCHLWSVDDGKELCTFPLEEYFPDPHSKRPANRAKSLLAAVFSSRGNRLLVSSRWNNTAVLIDTDTGERYARLRGHEAGITAAGFHPSGDTIATHSADGTLRIWNADRKTPVVITRTPLEVFDSVEFAQDGKTVLGTASDGALRVWDRTTGRLIRRLGTDLDRAHYAGRFLCGFATLGEHPNTSMGLRLWDAATGAPVEPPGALRDDFEEFALCEDRTRIATLRDKHVRVIATADGRVIANIETAGGYADESTLVLGPHGRLLATTFGSESTMIWRVADGRPVARIEVPGGAYRVRFTPDGAFVVVVDEDNATRLWEIDSGREVALFRGHRNWVVGSAMGPNGRYFATVSNDGTARVVDLIARKSLYALTPGVGALNMVRIGPHAQRLLVGTYDGEVLLYELASGNLLVRLHRDEGRLISNGTHQEPGELLADFAPDGRHVVTSSWDGSVRIWPVEPRTVARARALTPHERARYLDPLRDDYPALRAAQRLVDTLRNDLLIKQDVLDRIRTDREMDDAVRAHALRIAQDGELDAWTLEPPMWSILKAADRTPADYHFAARLQREIARLAYGNVKQNALAAAAVDVRLGRYKEAARALAAEDRKNDETARAFYAIALARMGRTDEAREEIELFRALGEDSEYESELKAEVDALLPK